MEYLIENKHRYAAAMLVYGYHNNVEHALKEAVRWERGEFLTLVSDWESYYLIYNSGWKTSYYIKSIDPYSKNKVPNVYNDDNVAKYNW
jgi:hypothetical protein